MGLSLGDHRGQAVLPALSFAKPSQPRSAASDTQAVVSSSSFATFDSGVPRPRDVFIRALNDDLEALEISGRVEMQRAVARKTDDHDCRPRFSNSPNTEPHSLGIGDENAPPYTVIEFQGKNATVRFS